VIESVGLREDVDYDAAAIVPMKDHDRRGTAYALRVNPIAARVPPQ
jgi:hypothetical protein